MAANEKKAQLIEEMNTILSLLLEHINKVENNKEQIVYNEVAIEILVKMSPDTFLKNVTSHTSDIQRHLNNGEYSKVETKINSFAKCGGNSYLWGQNINDHITYNEKDLLSKTPLQKLGFMLTYGMRAILRGVDALMSLSFTHTYNATGETPLARALTGNRQFFKNPNTTIKDTFEELNKVNNLLQHELRKSEEEQRKHRR